MVGDVRRAAGYSGLPASLARALSEMGVTIVPIDVELPPPLQRGLVNLMSLGFLDPRAAFRSWQTSSSVRLAFRASKPRLHPSREMMAVRSAVAAIRVRRNAPIERAVSWGSVFRLPRGTDYVTLDDATIFQLRESYEYEWMQVVSEPSLRRMIARQARIFHGARGCCAITHWAADSAVNHYKVPRERVHVVGLGPNRALAPRERDWSVPRFLFVGRDFERKNGPRLLRAFTEVRARFPTATLDVVGSHPSIDQDGVTGHGPLALDRPEDVLKVNDLFNRATCFVMPSLLEPAGIAFAEALGAGIPAIGPASGGSATIIGDAGVTVAPEDVPMLTQSMLRFCDPLEAQAVAARARARAPLFTWRATAERLVRVMELPGYDHDTLAEPL